MRDSKSGDRGQRTVWGLQIGFLKKRRRKICKGWKESGQLKSSEEKRPSWAHMIFVKIVHNWNVQIMQKMRELQQTESPINIRQTNLPVSHIKYHIMKYHAIMRRVR